jgi:hypothetical protein
MPEVSQITTHVTDAQGRLPSQFDNAGNLKNLVAAFATSTQDYEDLVFPLFTLLDIDAMEGEQLDGIGSIVNEDRQGRSDAEYREAIRLRISLNVSSGEPETVIALFKALTDPTGPVVYFEEQPASYSIYGDGDQFAELLAAMEAASPAGVHVSLLDDMLWEDGDDALWEDGDGIYVAYESSGG